MKGREIVIVEAVRTAIGKGNPESGYYRDTHASKLLGSCFKGVIDRAGIDPSVVEDVIVGCVQQVGEQSLNIGRSAWLEQGLPIETPATTIDRQCGSAQQGVNFGAALIAADVHDVVIGAGVEHMGHIPIDAAGEIQERFGSPYTPELLGATTLWGRASRPRSSPTGGNSVDQSSTSWC